MNENPTVFVCRDADDLAARAADRFVEAAQNAVAARERFTVALAGGSTPEAMYALLAEPLRRKQVPWAQTFVFFGDERFVPPGDELSNENMARRVLLDKVPLPATQIFSVDTTSAPNAEAAANAYENALAGFFGLEPAAETPPPVFDLVLLGLGDDGHTASLFPNKPALDIANRWAVATPPGVLPPPVDRVTLTFPVLNAARAVLFLVAGDKKAPALAAILEGGADVATHPAAGVKPATGTLTWLVDQAAASRLARRAA